MSTSSGDEAHTAFDFDAPELSQPRGEDLSTEEMLRRLAFQPRDLNAPLSIAAAKTVVPPDLMQLIVDTRFDELLIAPVGPGAL